MKILRIPVLILLCLILTSTANAGREFTVTPVDDTDFGTAGISELNKAITSVKVGNLNTPMLILSGWFTGAEGYKYLFNPVEQGVNCDVGFHLESVTMMMNFPAEATYPLSFNVYVDLEEPAPSEPGCWLPGPELCISDVYTVTIDVEGNYYVTLPITCQCAFMNYYYFVSIHFLDLLTANLITDEAPLPCTSYNDWGSGWVDLYDEGFSAYGLPILYGEGACCALPVENEENSWGQVKALYR